jgi:RimJ/RimL family protein N-acetyltransferase
VTFLADPPRRVLTDRLLLRPYAPDDAGLVKDAVDTSLEHLRTFMDWAWAAPEPVGVVRKRLRMFRDAFRHGDDWIYGLFDRDGSALVGGAGLHRRVGPEALEIGYWIRASRVRQGLATEAAAALTRLAFECCGAVWVEIHVDPANSASLAVAERLGYLREATLRKRLPPIRPGEPRRDEVVFSLLDEEYAGSPSAAFAVSGLD